MKLKDHPQWMLWRFDNGSKIPVNRWGDKSGSTRREDWISWNTACEAANRLMVQGPAFCFSSDDPFVGIDLDDCLVDEKTPKDWARPILARFRHTYCEISPGLGGVKIYCEGRKPAGYSNQAPCGDGQIEVYEHGRFFTFTELSIAADDVAECQEAIDWLFSTYWPKQETRIPRSTIEANGLDELAKLYVDHADLPSPGERNNTAFRLAGHLLAMQTDQGERLSPAKVLELLGYWNSKLSEPLADKELEQVCRSAEKNGTPREPKVIEIRETSIQDFSGITANGTEEENEIQTIEHCFLSEPIPDQCLHPGGLIERIIEYNMQTAIYPRVELALAGSLAMVSLITGCKVYDRWDLRTNAYFIGLCNSGGGKSHAKSVNNRILSDCGWTDAIMPKPKSGSAMVSYLRTSPASILQVDELADWLETMKNPNRNPHTFEILSILKELFSESWNPTWKPSAYADTKKNHTIYCPHLTFYGVAPSATFWQSLTKSNLTDGLVGRLMAFDSQGDNHSQDNCEKLPVPNVILEQVKSWIEFKGDKRGNLNDIKANFRPVRIEHTPDAWERYRDHGRNSEQRRYGESDESYALWCRTAEKTGKLAIMSACSRVVPDSENMPRIELFDVEWAIRLSNWITRNMVRNAGENVSENQTEDDAKKLLRKIPKSGISLTELTSKTRWLIGRYRRELLAELEMGAFVEIKNLPPSESRDKPITMIRRLV